MGWCYLSAACFSLREEWTKAIQAVAEGLQKQEEEMIDLSPDPMDMEVYLTKPRQKVVRPVWPCCVALLSPHRNTSFSININIKSPAGIPRWPLLFHGLCLICTSTHFPPRLPSFFFTFLTSGMGGLAPDSMSTRFHNPHVCHDIKVRGHRIICPPHNNFQHSP